MADKIRLGGMALPNGVLVHGPTSWGCAIRRPDGTIDVAAERKRFVSDERTPPLLRGPLKLLEAMAVLPSVRRALPSARLPFERPAVIAAMLASAVGLRAVRGSRLGTATQEVLSAVFSFAPAVLALRSSDLAAYHGAEHVSIGTYEHDEPRAKEHERCGSHLVGPILLTATRRQRARGEGAGAYPPARTRRCDARFTRRVDRDLLVDGAQPRAPVARALSRPGHELQHRVGTDEPSAEQLEVANAALDACLALEGA